MDGEKLTHKELNDFTWNMGLMIESGVPLCRALALVALRFSDQGNGPAAALITSINRELNEQKSKLFSAMKNTKAFPSFYVDMIETGEENCGMLDTVFNRLNRYFQTTFNNSIIEFCFLLGIMLSSGIPIIDALQCLKKFFSRDEEFAEAINDIQKNISKGGDVYGGMKKHKIFPEILLELVAVGEQTGSLDQILHKYAEAVMEHKK